MYSSIVHRIQRLELSFSEEDYEDWKRTNPDELHTHENYVMFTAKHAEDESFWHAVDYNIICLLYSKED